MTLKRELASLANREKAKIVARYLRAEERDSFLGVSVPDQRRVALKYRSLSLSSLEKLLSSNIHEERCCALFLLVDRYQIGEKEEVVDLYFKKIDGLDNWDLVDLSAPKILGDFFFDRDKERLEELISSESLWKRRIAIVSTYGFIRKGDIETTFNYAERLLEDSEPLIQKAVGWMLREAGKRDKEALLAFIQKHYDKMSRTTLRYSIERFSPEERKELLKR